MMNQRYWLAIFAASLSALPAFSAAPPDPGGEKGGVPVEPVSFQLPFASIADMETLPLLEFRERWTGIELPSGIPTDDGWYVFYRHQGLTYFFGPGMDRAQAIQAFDELFPIWQRASEIRPALKEAQLFVFYFCLDALFESLNNLPSPSSQADPSGSPSPSLFSGETRQDLPPDRGPASGPDAMEAGRLSRDNGRDGQDSTDPSLMPFPPGEIQDGAETGQEPSEEGNPSADSADRQNDWTQSGRETNRPTGQEPRPLSFWERIRRLFGR